MTSESPAFDASARNVSRPNHDVRTVVERANEVRQVLHVVREVGVHFEETVVAFREPLGERLDVGGSQPQFPCAMQDPNMRIALGDAVGDVAGPVR